MLELKFVCVLEFLLMLVLVSASVRAPATTCCSCSFHPSQGQEADMVMTSLSGHLLNMEFGPQYKKWSV